MKRKIIKALDVILIEAKNIVKASIPVIKRQAMYSASASQYYYDEARKLVKDYKKSDVGDYYVKSNFPNFTTDKDIIVFMAKFYLWQVNWLLKRMLKHGYELTEDAQLNNIKEDAYKFLNTYLLERSLLEMAKGVNTNSDFTIPPKYKSDFYFIFSNNQVNAINFLEDVSKLKEPRDTASIIATLFNYNVKLWSINKRALYNVLKENGLISCSYPNLTYYIRKQIN